MALVLVTMKAFAAELLTIETEDESDKTSTRPSLRSLLRNRYVVLIMVFQMLSAVESQLLDFLVYDHAGRRYTNSTDLATFVGRFSAIAYGADIVFLIILAGLLMGRFGLRFGLFANPAFVLTLVGASIAGAVMQGSASTVVFLLVGATRVSDMVLADGTTRTSVGAAYQAVPSAQRTASQAVVESLAVPLAIGVSGAILLAIRATVGTEGLAIPVIVAATLALWIVCALGVYRGYGVNLLDTLRHRQLDPSEIVVDDAETLVVVEALLASDDRRDIRLGLAALQRSGHATFVEHLERMVASQRDGETAMALHLLAEADPRRAAGLARNMLHDPRRTYGPPHCGRSRRPRRTATLNALPRSSSTPTAVSDWPQPTRSVGFRTTKPIEVFMTSLLRERGIPTPTDASRQPRCLRPPPCSR